MSPKQITRVGLVVGAISLVSVIPMLLIQPDWGSLNWLPAMGLVVALMLLVASFLRGAYLTAQRRVDMVDMLNDCYTGTEGEENGLKGVV
ncbi:MAG: hypothetical protein AAF485_21840 [Chloroflexota bacterium]